MGQETCKVNPILVEGISNTDRISVSVETFTNNNGKCLKKGGCGFNASVIFKRTGFDKKALPPVLYIYLCPNHADELAPNWKKCVADKEKKTFESFLTSNPGTHWNKSIMKGNIETKSTVLEMTTKMNEGKLPRTSPRLGRQGGVDFNGDVAAKIRAEREKQTVETENRKVAERLEGEMLAAEEDMETMETIAEDAEAETAEAEKEKQAAEALAKKEEEEEMAAAKKKAEDDAKAAADAEKKKQAAEALAKKKEEEMAAAKKKAEEAAAEAEKEKQAAEALAKKEEEEMAAAKKKAEDDAKAAADAEKKKQAVEAEAKKKEEEMAAAKKKAEDDEKAAPASEKEKQSVDFGFELEYDPLTSFEYGDHAYVSQTTSTSVAADDNQTKVFREFAKQHEAIVKQFRLIVQWYQGLNTVGMGTENDFEEIDRTIETVVRNHYAKKYRGSNTTQPTKSVDSSNALPVSTTENIMNNLRKLLEAYKTEDEGRIAFDVDAHMYQFVEEKNELKKISDALLVVANSTILNKPPPEEVLGGTPLVVGKKPATKKRATKKPATKKRRHNGVGVDVEGMSCMSTATSSNVIHSPSNEDGTSFPYACCELALPQLFPTLEPNRQNEDSQASSKFSTNRQLFRVKPNLYDRLPDVWSSHQHSGEDKVRYLFPSMQPRDWWSSPTGLENLEASVYWLKTMPLICFANSYAKHHSLKNVNDELGTMLDEFCSDLSFCDPKNSSNIVPSSSLTFLRL